MSSRTISKRVRPNSLSLTKPVKLPPMAGRKWKFYSGGNETMKFPWGIVRIFKENDGSRVQSSQ